MDVTVFGIGTVGAKDIYNINALTAGKILTITTDEGKWVKKGDLLVVMDPVDLPQIIEAAKITVQKARLEAKASQKEMETLFAQKRLAQITYRRYAKLKAQSFASQSEYDKAKSDLDALDAQIAATKARIGSAKAEIKRAEKNVKALEVKSEHNKIYAPIDGYVIERKADVAQSVLPTEAILKVVDPKTVWIRAYIDERISGAIKVGQEAIIHLRSQPKKKFAGIVKRIVAQSDPVTQEREVDVAFKELPIPFYINEQAEVTIVTKKLHDVVEIPADALVNYKAKRGVWIDRESKAHFVALQVIATDEDYAAVSGLELSMRVIMPSAKKKPLYEGAGIH
jgi:RND family efflux transporter MFP subunit